MLERMLESLPFSRAELEKIIRTAPYRYKVYYINKRSGNGKREIAQPSAELKLIQRWVVDNVLSSYPIHSAAAAYVQGKGIRANAESHASNRYLLKLDFHNFFPSLKSSDFVSHTERFAQDFVPHIGLLSKILFRKRDRGGDLFLAIGAPSSPMLSNSLLYDFDCELSRYCLETRVSYSRYADDLTFSTNQHGVLSEVHGYVAKVLSSARYPKLAINQEKTIYSSKRHNRTVTGLVISNEGLVTIGRDKKRLIRALIHKASIGSLSQEDLDWLRGYLAFVPDAEYSYWEKLSLQVTPSVKTLVGL